MNSTQTLPACIKPMLAQTGEPFDSDEHLFEIKWDGLRGMAYVDADGYRLLNRRGTDITRRYPEFAALQALPAGTLLDGEIVVLDAAGKPSFHQVMQREAGGTRRKVKAQARRMPAQFVAFDQLYEQYNSLLDAPLLQRRSALMRTLGEGPPDRIIPSEGVIGPGRDFFQEVVARDLEGMVAKRLSAPYFPGRRADAWLKVRKQSAVLCAIIGYVPDGEDFESLILATDDGGGLRYVGRVGNGFGLRQRRELNVLLRQHPARAPLVPCPVKGIWVEPGLYCSVRFLEWSRGRDLREPVFERLISGEDDHA